MNKRLFSVFLVVLLLALAVTSSVSAQGPVVSRLATVSVGSYDVAVGDTFTVPVTITGVSNLYGADVKLVFDNTVLQGVSVERGTLLSPDFVVRQGFYSHPSIKGLYARYALTQVNPTPPVTGSGVLMYVTFRAVAPGTSTLALSGILSDRNGVRLPFVTQGGMVTVVDAEQDR